MNDKTEYAALILRIGLGVMFIAHGLLKVMVFTLPGTAGFFESVGFPGWVAYIVAVAEIGGGALLIAGIAVRTVTLALIPVLLGALFVHFGSGCQGFNEDELVAEIGGGVLLIAGVAVRAVSAALIPVLLGAVFVHFGSGWVFSNPNGGWEYPAFLVVASVVQVLLGPGKFALTVPGVPQLQRA